MTELPSRRPGVGALVRDLLVAPHLHLREALPVWGLLAFSGLAFGVWFSVGAAHSESYFEVRWWLEQWIAGANVYGHQILVDYPPQALILLRPLAWLPKAHGEVAWAVVNAGISVASAWMLVSVTGQLVDSKLSRIQRATFVLMLISWAPTRINIWNGQTTALIVLLLCVGIRFAKSSPLLAGIALGLGTSKPHVAVAFLILAAFQRRWKVLIIATVTATSLALLYCASVGANPLSVLREYIAVLTGVYGGPRFLRGEVDMRPLWLDLFGSYGLAEPLFLMTSAAIGAIVLQLTWRARHDQSAAISVFAAWLTWSLAVLPFRRYGLMLMAPSILSLLWRPGLRSSLRKITSLFIVMLVIDIPWITRHVLNRYGPGIAERVDKSVPMAHYSTRFAILLLLAISIVLLARVADDAQHSHEHV